VALCGHSTAYKVFLPNPDRASKFAPQSFEL
jgi:hypothetical protein